MDVFEAIFALIATRDTVTNPDLGSRTPKRACLCSSSICGAWVGSIPRRNVRSIASFSKGSDYDTE